MSQNPNPFVAKTQSYFITYPTRLIPQSPCNKVEYKQSLYLGIKATQRQISPSSGYPRGSPRITSSYSPTTEILRCQSIIPIYTSMITNPPSMHEFLSPTFACIQSRIFLSPSLYLTNQAITFPIQEKSRVKSLQRKTKISCLAIVLYQGDGLTNLPVVIFGCPLHHKSRISKLRFHFVIIVNIIDLYVYIQKKFYKIFCLKVLMQIFSV